MPASDIDAEFTNIDERDMHVTQQVWPLDEHNQTLLNHVHPPEWKDPVVKNDDHYDLVVVGGGTAGLVTAAGLAGVGACVAMIEAHILGGDWYVIVCALLHAFAQCSFRSHSHLPP
jgi:heterodisulfide reductase subunit A-like polyferredoxin